MAFEIPVEATSRGECKAEGARAEPEIFAPARKQSVDRTYMVGNGSAVAEADPDSSTLHIRFAAHFDRMPVQKCPSALPRRKEFGGERMIDNAKYQLAG